MAKKSFIEVGDEIKKRKCNHKPENSKTTLRPIIKRPLAGLTPEEKKVEMAKPSYFCSNCRAKL